MWAIGNRQTGSGSVQSQDKTIQSEWQPASSNVRKHVTDSKSETKQQTRVKVEINEFELCD